MNFSELNYLGVIIAFAISFVSGGIWFGPKTFYPIWMKARGIGNGELNAQQNKPAILFGGTIVGVLIQTLTLAIVITSLQSGNPEFSVLDGALVGAALGVGIAAFASLSHRLFGGENFKVWIIETSNDALNLTIAGAVITFFN
ncbi:unannotated protein [freshwater metagenome]|uniref:Unannotated protein n=1 Tax=freshwater metagenome TaxID=449393 RepID=A0A6J6G4D5_9ZZZZ|nr:DUF1761 family protein [Actinomycetota bacterium]